MRSQKSASSDPTPADVAAGGDVAATRFAGTVQHLSEAAFDAVDAAREARGHYAAERLRAEQPGMFRRILRALRVTR